MYVNWKRGFNRVFAVVAVAWAAYIFLYLPVQQWHERFDMRLDRWTLCSSAASGDMGRLAECNAKYDKDFREIPQTAWTDIGWVGWLQLLGLASVPPSIVYWLLRGSWYLCNWIWRGFSTR
jgi:hypothetical protein